MDMHMTEVVLSHEGVELVRVMLEPGEYILGRGHDATIRAETPLISRRHARIVIEEDHAIIEDLGSSNGTTVGGESIGSPTLVRPDHEIRLGDVRLEVRRHLGPSDTTRTARTASSLAEAARRYLPTEFQREQRYAIGKLVAQGGQGAILDAREATTQRSVAMKVMLEGQEEADVLRFIEEAQVTAQLEHPNIVPVHDLGVDEREQLYYTMKLVRGITLKKVLDLMAEGKAATIKKYPLPALLTIFQKVCDAIAFSHSRQVIHRDLKPENVMLGDYGEVLVMDWGLAKVLGGADRAAAVTSSTITTSRASEGQFGNTLSGMVMGTPYYMSPEQAAGDIARLDQRADVYSLGAMLFEILHLRYAVSGSTLEEVIGRAREGQLDWGPPAKTHLARTLSHLPGGRVPESLLAVCRKALAFDPAARYQKVEELQADIDAYQHGFATSAEKKTPLKNFIMLLRRRKIEATATALVLLSVGWFGTNAFLSGRRATKALTALQQAAPELLRLAASDANFQNYTSALKNIDAALAIDPTLKDGYWRRAWALLAQDKFAEAADAIRTAQQKDPARAGSFGRILPQVEKLAAATSDELRNDMGLISAVFTHLRAVGASGESSVFTRRLRLSTNERLNLVRERLVEWVGKDGFSSSSTPTGYLEVRLKPGAASNLDGLRGVPLDILEASRCRITTLEPLRGMKLGKLVLSDNPLDDLTPLAGMSLFELNISNTSVSDLSPVAGAPLDVFIASSTLINDIAPLHGAPIQKLLVQNTRIVDFSPLAGAPLKEAQLSGTRLSSLKFLEKSPLEILTLNGCPLLTDLSPLRGLPLSRVEMTGTNVTDLTPLRALPIRSLNIDNCKKIADFTPLLDLPQLDRFSCTGVPQALETMRKHPTLKVIIYQFPAEPSAIDRPVADFWKKYDAAKK
jgi:serine/threonine protein kinase